MKVKCCGWVTTDMVFVMLSRLLLLVDTFHVLVVKCEWQSVVQECAVRMQVLWDVMHVDW
jgi:hypothetical protein